MGIVNWVKALFSRKEKGYLVAEVREGKRGKIWFTIMTRKGHKLAQNITPGFTGYKAMTEVVRQLEGRKIVIRLRSNK